MCYLVLSSMSMNKRRTAKGSAAAQPRAKMIVLGEADEMLDWLVGRYVTAEGRAAVSRSEVVRALVQRAYRKATRRRKTE